AGTLKAGDSNLGTLGLNAPQTTVEAGAVIDLAGYSNILTNLQGSGTVTNSGAATNLTLIGGDFAGTISGPLTLTTLGNQTLSGSNTYTGNTTIDFATLTLGNGGMSGSLPSGSAVTDSGSLAFDRSDAFTFGDVISGSGTVQQIGTGTTTLT